VGIIGFESEDFKMESLIVLLGILAVMFLVYALILRWIFRIDEIVFYLKQIKDRLNKMK